MSFPALDAVYRHVILPLTNQRRWKSALLLQHDFERTRRKLQLERVREFTLQ